MTTPDQATTDTALGRANPQLGPWTPAVGEATALRVEAGSVLFDEGAPCRGFPFVLAGEVKVARGSAGGRSIELYRVTPGEFCVVSAGCLFGRRPLGAHGVATMQAELRVLKPAGFDRACAQADFRRHVFGLFADRLADVIALAEAVAFQRLDQRLAALLLSRAPLRAVTHQALADELGTVRDMVTRLLGRFERAGLVHSAREQIDVLDGTGLRRVAAG